MVDSAELPELDSGAVESQLSSLLVELLDSLLEVLESVLELLTVVDSAAVAALAIVK